MKKIILFNLLFTIMLYSEELTNSTQINISKTWSQEPFGWVYPIDINGERCLSMLSAHALISDLS